MKPETFEKQIPQGTQIDASLLESWLLKRLQEKDEKPKPNTPYDEIARNGQESGLTAVLNRLRQYVPSHQKLGTKKLYYTEVVDAYNEPENTGIFKVKEDAVNFLKAFYGADDEGRISLLCEVEVSEEEYAERKTECRIIKEHKKYMRR